MADSPVKLVKVFFSLNLKEMKEEYMASGNPAKTLTDADKADFTTALTPDPATGVPSYTY
jgi:hypothetical protein